MSRKTENTGFLCEHCGAEVLPVTNGSYRNHCPQCLFSKHVDDLPGDRNNKCGGLMEPVKIEIHSKKGYQIRHRCRKCNTEQINKIATDTVQPDDLQKILEIMAASR